MSTNKFVNLSNAEIKIKLKEYESEYEVIKNKINEYVHRLDELDKLFNDGKKELSKRNVL